MVVGLKAVGEEEAEDRVIVRNVVGVGEGVEGGGDIVTVTMEGVGKGSIGVGPRDVGLLLSREGSGSAVEGRRDG